MFKTYRRLFAFIVLAAAFASPVAHAQIIINTPVNISSNTVWNDDVFIVAGGILTIDPSVILEITPGYNFFVQAGGQLMVTNDARLLLDQGTFITDPGSSTVFDPNSALLFQDDGRCAFAGGTATFNAATIECTNPAAYHALWIFDSYTFQGDCRVVSFDITHINAPFWFIANGSNIVFENGCNFDDPTGAANHSIEAAGTLRFNPGTYSFSTTPANRLRRIHVPTYGSLIIDNATMEDLPDILGQHDTYMLVNNSQCSFYNTAGYSSRGFIDLFDSHFYAYNPGGWRGVKAYADIAFLRMINCHVEHTVGYAVKIERTSVYQHIIDHSILSHPDVQYTGDGLWIEGDGVWTPNVRVECSRIQDFDNGVHMTLGMLDMQNSASIYNNNGFYIHDNSQSQIEYSLIAYNQVDGIRLEGATGNILNYCEMRMNGNVQISLDANMTGSSDINGGWNNIHTNIPAVFLVRVYGMSNATLSDCYWGVFPPVIGVDFDVQPGSTMNFPAWQWFSNPVTGWNTCGMPKYTTLPSIALKPVSPEISIHNFPNPFNPSTQIEYSLPEEMNATVKVYSLTGKEIATLVEGQQKAGVHTVTFTASSDIPSGTYIYSIQTPAGIKRGMMTLTK